MDRWAWEHLAPWLSIRASLPVGAVFGVLRGATRERPCSAAAIRVQLRNAAAQAGIRRRFAPHQPRHAHAVEMSREGLPAVVLQRQLGHAHLGITSVYLRGNDNTETIHTVHERPAPMSPATNGLGTRCLTPRDHETPRSTAHHRGTPPVATRVSGRSAVARTKEASEHLRPLWRSSWSIVSAGRGPSRPASCIPAADS
jgi:hypothetical protein